METDKCLKFGGFNDDKEIEGVRGIVGDKSFGTCDTGEGWVL